MVLQNELFGGWQFTSIKRSLRRTVSTEFTHFYRVRKYYAISYVTPFHAFIKYLQSVKYKYTFIILYKKIAIGFLLSLRKEIYLRDFIKYLYNQSYIHQPCGAKLDVRDIRQSFCSMPTTFSAIFCVKLWFTTF